MIGGAGDAFIGAVHRMAASVDGQIELVCGAFSSHADKSIQTGKDLGLADNRIYTSYQEMILQEAKLPESERMEFVSIVTPNHLHFEPCMLALDNGFHVLCEKPLALNVQEATLLEQKIKATGLLFGLMHNYTGYPMVKQAREMIQKGNLGKIRKVVVEYMQGWLTDRIETSGQKQASWRTDPTKAGISCCTGDIGTHAENLAEYITGLKIQELAADVTSVVEGRTLDDDASVLLRMENGVKGLLFCSQIATGEQNELKIRVYGENGGLEWLQSEPNVLKLLWKDAPEQIYRTGAGKSYLSDAALAHTRLPGGHPEGYLEAMANLYRNFAYHIRAVKNSVDTNPLFDYPTISDGVRGMRFIEAVIESGKQNASWVKL